MIPVWIATVMLYGVPYAIAALCVPPQRMGVYVGLINCAVTIGEQSAVGVDAITFLIAKHLPKKWNIGENRANIGGGMVCAWAGMILAMFLKVPKEHADEGMLVTTPLLATEGRMGDDPKEDEG
jgi:hypothetical protein